MNLNSIMEGPSSGEQDRGCRNGNSSSNEEWKGEKKSPKKDSMDSGAATIRDNHLNDKNKNCSGCSDTESSEIEVSSERTTYMKGKFLGKGGFAHVHELVDLSTQIVYAGKIIPKNRITKPHHIQKIAREISIHRNLVHKNVVRLHHFFEDKVNAYIVLENCSQKSLFHVLKHRYSVTEPEARYYLRQLVEGVRYIHSQKVIHRDLKPGNMLLTEDMVVKLGDFGLATVVDGNKKGSLCGTPNYMAPEVLKKLNYSYEADVWALGCILYAMLVGQPPFETASLKETYTRIVNNKYTIPLQLSEPARKLIRQLLHPQPESRMLIDKINNHEFFKNGYTPNSLSPICVFATPVFNNNNVERQGAHESEGGEIVESSRSPVIHNTAAPVVSTSCTSSVITTTSSSGVVISSLISSTNSLTNAVTTTVIYSTQTCTTCTSTCTSSTATRTTAKSSVCGISSHKNNIQKNALLTKITLKQKLTSVLCPDKIGRKKENNVLSLYHVVMSCLRTMPLPSDESQVNPTAVICFPIFVSKWIDYSNKYGFGFQLSDKSVGVLFNDNTRMSFSADRSNVEFYDTNGKVATYPHKVPETLHQRLALLEYFSHYMQENLTDGGYVTTRSSEKQKSIVQMKRWVRTNTAIIMELTNGTLQINFFKDHTKIILSAGNHGYVLTYINGERQSCSYLLHQIAEIGSEKNIYNRLKFAAAVLREFAELDGELV